LKDNQLTSERGILSLKSADYGETNFSKRNKSSATVVVDVA
jgi:hypothetical protein